VLNTNDIIWKAIKGFEGQYEVSNTGLIKSLERQVRNTQSSFRTVKEKLLTQFPSATVDYLYIPLSQNRVSKKYAVHRIVAEAFCNNPENKPHVNHLDGNKLNNNAYNLEWVTISENHQHAWNTGLCDKEKSYKRMIGTKYNAKSKYHNVSWDNSRNKWIGFIKHQGKVHFNKRFNTEIEAALYVNTLIDKLGLLDRPKNIIS
jgi:hypothetical protein